MEKSENGGSLWATSNIGTTTAGPDHLKDLNDTTFGLLFG